MTLTAGDVVEVGLGRQTVSGIFQGFDERVYAFYLILSSGGEEMLIPYKSIKYLKKVSGR